MVASHAKDLSGQIDSRRSKPGRHDMRQCIEHLANHPEDIEGHLRELDAEWDVERLLQLEAGIVGGYGLLRASVGSRLWLALPGVVSWFLIQHAIQGWSPPVALLRRMGFRTRAEIDQERCALKALRRDLKDGPAPPGS